MAQQQLVALQQTLTQQSRQLSQTLSLTQANRREQGKGKATLEELRRLPTDTCSYRACGRMFLREPLPVLADVIEGQLALVAAQIEKLEQQTTYLKQAVKGTEQEMQEVIRHIYEKRGQ